MTCIHPWMAGDIRLSDSYMRAVTPPARTATLGDFGDQVVGTCSKCKGAVCIPRLWSGVTPPVPTCRSCGAKKKNAHGPLIEME